MAAVATGSYFHQFLEESQDVFFFLKIKRFKTADLVYSGFICFLETIFRKIRKNVGGLIKKKKAER